MFIVFSCVTAMDKTTINKVVAYFQKALAENGLEDNRIALFGSALHGIMHSDSDIDMIVVSSRSSCPSTRI